MIPLALAEYRLAFKGAFEQRVEEALKDDEIEDAAQLIEIRQKAGHSFDPDLVERTRESIASKSWRYARGFADGFIYGEATTMPNPFGSVAADWAVVGDYAAAEAAYKARLRLGEEEIEQFYATHGEGHTPVWRST